MFQDDIAGMIRDFVGLAKETGRSEFVTAGQIRQSCAVPEGFDIGGCRVYEGTNDSSLGTMMILAEDGSAYSILFPYASDVLVEEYTFTFDGDKDPLLMLVPFEIEDESRANRNWPVLVSYLGHWAMDPEPEVREKVIELLVHVSRKTNGIFGGWFESEQIPVAGVAA